MANPIPALIFGAFLMVTGFVMLVGQRKNLRQALAGEPSEKEASFLRRRYRRRCQIGGMILVIGLMIPVGDSLIPWEEAPATFAVYWMIVLGLALWTGVLAMGDMASTKIYMTSELNRLHRQELQLRDTVDRLRNRNDSGER